MDWSARVAGDAPLTGAQRVHQFLYTNFASPSAFFRTVGPALGAEAANRPEDWGRTWDGLGRRVGLNFVTFTSQDLIHATAAAAQGLDPRYQRCECKGSMRRVGHAFTGLVMSADGHGARRFDLSNIGSSYAAGFIGAQLYPERYSKVVKGSQLGHLQVGQVVTDNLFQEFGPDIKKFFREKVLRKK